MTSTSTSSRHGTTSTPPSRTSATTRCSSRSAAGSTSTSSRTTRRRGSRPRTRWPSSSTSSSRLTRRSWGDERRKRTRTRVVVMSDAALDPSLASLEQRVADAPDDAQAWRELAEELVATGVEVRAAAALKRFLELVPGDVDALSDLAHLEHRAGHSAEAVDLLGRAVETSQFPKSLLRNLIDLH